MILEVEGDHSTVRRKQKHESMSMTFVSGRQRPEPSQQTVQSVSGKTVQFPLGLGLTMFVIGFINALSTKDDSFIFKFISCS